MARRGDGDLSGRSLEELEEELQHYQKLLEEEKAELSELRAFKNTGGSEADESGARLDEQYLLQEDVVGLRRRVQRLKRSFGLLRQSAEVVELKNKTVAVMKEIEGIRTEVRTLEAEHGKLGKGVKELHRGDRAIKAIRNKQNEEHLELREKLKKLNDELRTLEREDTQLHQRFADLQRQIKFSIPAKDVDALKETYQKQMEDISDLRRRRDYLESLRRGVRKGRRMETTKEGKAKARAEKKIEELKRLLETRMEEFNMLKKSLDESIASTT
ncbi:hypothetical protein TRVL_03342 [Trypanosoma vivax]|nr:hypothetical protein TRVL_03342 [Trypanosoma vivax]